MQEWDRKLLQKCRLKWIRSIVERSDCGEEWGSCFSLLFCTREDVFCISIKQSTERKEHGWQNRLNRCQINYHCALKGLVFFLFTVLGFVSARSFACGTRMKWVWRNKGETRRRLQLGGRQPIRQLFSLPNHPITNMLLSVNTNSSQ